MRIVAGIVFLVIVIVLLQTIFPHFLPSIFQSMAMPFWRVQFAMSTGLMKSQAELLNENESLRREIEENAILMSNIKSVEDENKELKSLLGRDVNYSVAIISTTSSSTNSLAGIRNKNTTKRILTAVLVKPPFIPYDEYIIDGGLDLGFHVGDLVYVSPNIPIGSIKDVFANSSKVILNSSPQEKYQVSIGPSNISAVAIGNGGGQYSIQLPRKTLVVEGDYVRSPSLNDLPLGTVKTIISDPTEAFETVIVAPSFNPYSVRWVLVDTK